jgi:hypothetical protein
METVPKGLSPDLESYFTRTLSRLEDLQSNQVPELRTSLPAKPILGRLYYFKNEILPTITPIGLWIYKATGWTFII